MSRTLRIIERAQSDVDHVFNWLAQRSVQGAISWYLEFRRAIEKIGASQETFAEAPESHALGRPLRQAPFKTRRGRVYRIVFEVSGATIIVLRVRGPGQAPLRGRDLPAH
jgi:plasmid stabilization system protein ParE